MQNENLIKKEPKPIGIKWDLETKKEVAKIGMTASLVAVVGTSFAMKSKTMTNLHIGAGVALIGFSLWHHLLYQPTSSKKKQNTLPLPEKKEDISPPALIFKEMYAAISLEGSLTHIELEMFEARLEALLKSYEKPATLLLIDATLLDSIEMSALWHDLVLGLGKHPEVTKVAFVGKNRLEKISIALTNAIITKELHFFETHDEARNWLLS